MPEVQQEYQRAPGRGKFLYLGIDLKHPPDLMPQGKTPYMMNLSPNQVQGGVTSRAGLVKIGDTGSGYPIHSLARVNNDIPGVPLTWTRFAGSAGSVYRGQSGTLASVDSGYSGNPMSMVPYRPPMSPEAWLYVYDSIRQSKFRVDGTRQNIGVAPPIKPPGTTLTQPNVQSILDVASGGGTVLGRPTVSLNGWGNNAHEGPYEMGVDQGLNWGLNDDTTYSYTNPGNAVDGDPATSATCTFAHTHKYAGCIYQFAGIATPPSLYLNVYSSVPTSGSGQLRSSGVWYTLNNGTTWTMLYNAPTRALQWDSVPLSTSQDCSQIQVMVFLDSHDDMSHSVYDIQLNTAPGASGTWAASGAAATPTIVDRVTPAEVASAIVYDSGTTGWACVTPKAASAGAEYTGWGIGMRVVIDNELTTITDVFPFLSNTTVGAVFKDDSSVATIVPGTPPPSVRRDATVLINGYAHRVLSVTTGPENTLSFRVLDNVVPGGITAGLSLRFPISFRCYLAQNHAAGVAIGAKAFQSVMTLSGTAAGTGMIYNNALGPVNGMGVNGRPITDEDYVHVSIAIDNPANVAEVHFLLDIDAQGNNDFQHNYFYYVVRQNDFQSVAQGTQTSIGGLLDALTAQIASTYPVEKDKIQYAQNPYPAYQQPEFGIPVSDQLGAGMGQWFEAIFKVSDLTRVGSDISTNLSNIRGAAVLVELTGNATISIGGWWIGGTYGPDCNYNSYGNQGQPILYRYRYRSSLTGTFSEVSPATRNGILAMRSGVLVSVAASSDPQVDLIDVERNGGTFDTWHRCLVVPNATAQVLDDVRETVALGGDPLELLHYQPWPVTDQPRSGTCNIIGNRVHQLTGDLFNLSWVRGVEVIVNRQTYTLYASPYTTSDLELAENVGSFSNVLFKIPEATIAGYPLAHACQGMDGRIFATGDPFNPGNLYFSQPYEPDSASDQGYIEVTGPSEPLGPPVFYEGAVYVFSNLAGYRVESTPGQVNPYTAFKLGTVAGQIMDWSISGEGPAIFYRGPDGVYLFQSGGSINITRDDLFPLLPFESRPGLPVSVAGQVLYPPDDSKPQRQRMSYADGMLFYDYMDITGAWSTLTWAVDTKGWCPYKYLPGVACHYQEQGASDPLTLAGGTNGVLYALDPALTDDGQIFQCSIVTPADDQGDSRATKEYGDLMMDIGVRNPASYTFTVTVTDSAGVHSNVTCTIAEG